MKKNTIKAFTLVEMLIVIVIIGILIAALMPRMQSAQWRARDVARKNDLSQIQTAIVTSQQDKWKWPWTWTEYTTIAVKDIADFLTTAWMSAVPQDPLTSSSFTWMGNTFIRSGNYAYAILKRNGTAKWWFVLMAKTEIEWWSNWVVCNAASSNVNTTKNQITNWVINVANDATISDIKNIHPCTKLRKATAADTVKCSTEDPNDCVYENEWQLRYIITY
jgi:prepilin-type N-terminal cleavage/methylation domain-containing protein